MRNKFDTRWISMFDSCIISFRSTTTMPWNLGHGQTHLSLTARYADSDSNSKEHQYNVPESMTILPDGIMSPGADKVISLSTAWRSNFLNRKKLGTNQQLRLNVMLIECENLPTFAKLRFHSALDYRGCRATNTNLDQIEYRRTVRCFISFQMLFMKTHTCVVFAYKLCFR